MTGRPGYRTMEMNGRSALSYLVRRQGILVPFNLWETKDFSRNYASIFVIVANITISDLLCVIGSAQSNHTE